MTLLLEDGMMEQLTTMTYERTGRIARITLNRPERGNGITMDMPRELTACVECAREMSHDARGVCGNV